MAIRALAPAPAAVEVCRHLGMSGDAQHRLDLPSTSHRCHLWSQREQVDLVHQREYCFTAAHRHCPWLSVPPAGQKRADQHLPKAKVAVGGGLAALLCAGVVLASTVSPWLGDGPRFGGAQPRVRVAAAAATPPASVESRARPARSDKTMIDPLPFGSLDAGLLATGNPQTVSAKLDASTGGTVVAGNVGLSFSPKALSEMGGSATVHVEAQPKANVPGGPAQFSPNGSIVDITVRNADGNLITTFPDPVDVLFKYNSSDLAMAHGDARALSAAYVIDDQSPDLENPLQFPVNTWVFFPPSNLQVDPDAGTVGVRTQAIGSIFSVVAVGAGWAQTLRPGVQLHSSFDPATSSVFGEKKQFSYLRVVEPQIGGRLLVLDAETGDYAYVNARDVGPSGAPSRQAAPRCAGPYCMLFT